MTNEKIYLYEGNENVFLDVYLCDEHEAYSITTRPFILICPGGGYSHCSPREAEPVARAYMAYGYNAAILYYSVKANTDILFDNKNGFSKPHYEISKSICIIRDNAKKWHINPEQIAVIGFSAGAHVAGCCSILWNDENVVNAIGCKRGYNKPNASLLCYPVITSGKKGHFGSFKNLLGEYATKENLKRYSLEKQVTKSVPPTFIIHTSDDKSVPVQNATELATALANKGVLYELHVFPEGRHGMSLATREVNNTTDDIAKNNRVWLNWSVNWLEKIFNL